MTNRGPPAEWPTVYVLEIAIHGSPRDPGQYSSDVVPYQAYRDYPANRLDDTNGTLYLFAYPNATPMRDHELLVLGHLERVSPALVVKQECYFAAFQMHKAGLEMDGLLFEAFPLNERKVDVRFGRTATNGEWINAGQDPPYNVSIRRSVEELAYVPGAGDVHYQSMETEFDYQVTFHYHGLMVVRPLPEFEPSMEFQSPPQGIDLARDENRPHACYGV